MFDKGILYKNKPRPFIVNARTKPELHARPGHGGLYLFFACQIIQIQIISFTQQDYTDLYPKH